LNTPLNSLATQVVPAGFSVVEVVDVDDVEEVDVDVVEGLVEWRLRVTMATNAANIASNLRARLTD
jgi:ribosomal protein L32E